MVDIIEKTDQRVDYTFKYNTKLKRHGWLRLTPAYSVKLVEELVIKTPRDGVIMDPFSGTATTGLCAAEKGMRAYLHDINPFLVWFGNAKLKVYKESEINFQQHTVKEIIEKFHCRIGHDNWLPNMHNIERWWSGQTLSIISALRAEIVHSIGEIDSKSCGNLIWIAFCRLVIETSSAAFNHVSMSFKDETKDFCLNQIKWLFEEIFIRISSDAKSTFSGYAEVHLVDSKEISGCQFNGVDHVITSPPYPNRMSYIRELRPYMYWTKFLDKSSEAGELDWKAIGGTWGIATSRLSDWAPSEIELPKSLDGICNKILKSGDKNSSLMARYVHKYFYDMHCHFTSIRNLLNDGARLDYIVGNSTFYGVHVPSDILYEESLSILGFKEIKTSVVRKRNSNKALFEYCVSAVY